MLSTAGERKFTTCIYHPDWPYSENDQNLPVQQIPGRVAYCGAWESAGPGPLQIRVKAGYEAKSVQLFGGAALALVLLFGVCGMLVRGEGFLPRHTLTTLWLASCYLWTALIPQLDGLRMLSPWFGVSGHSRWLWAGLAASVPPLCVARFFSFRRDPLLSRMLRKRAAFGMAAFVVITALFRGALLDGPLIPFVYGLGILVFLIAMQAGTARSKAIPVTAGELFASCHGRCRRARNEEADSDLGQPAGPLLETRDGCSHRA